MKFLFLMFCTFWISQPCIAVASDSKIAQMKKEFEVLSDKIDDLSLYEEISSADERKLREMEKRQRELREEIDVAVEKAEKKNEFGSRSPAVGSELQAACEGFLKRANIEAKGEFFVQMSKKGSKIRLFTDQGFSEFESKRQTCTFFDKTKPERPSAKNHEDAFSYAASYNKASLLERIFKDALVPGVKNKNMIPGKRCIKFYKEGESRALDFVGEAYSNEDSDSRAAD